MNISLSQRWFQPSRVSLCIYLNSSSICSEFSFSYFCFLFSSYMIKIIICLRKSGISVERIPVCNVTEKIGGLWHTPLYHYDVVLFSG